PLSLLFSLLRLFHFRSQLLEGTRVLITYLLLLLFLLRSLALFFLPLLLQFLEFFFDCLHLRGGIGELTLLLLDSPLCSSCLLFLLPHSRRERLRLGTKIRDHLLQFGLLPLTDYLVALLLLPLLFQF
ncbi:hypothetical protein PMAYCL1PPCAC_13017, partial [Pristionchus mayeri]